MHNYYITPEEYEIAERNGIKEKTLHSRIRVLGWSKEKAIHTPVVNMSKSKWVKVAAENGISYRTFMHRVRKQGLSEEQAATMKLWRV